MKNVCWLLALVLVVLLVGCSRPEVPPSDPLTVEQWKALPAESKYEASTLERLKLGDPKLQDEREWDQFARKVLIPARKKDFPKGMPGK